MYEKLSKKEIKEKIKEIEKEISERKAVHNAEISKKNKNFAEPDYDDDMADLNAKLGELKSLL